MSTAEFNLLPARVQAFVAARAATRRIAFSAVALVIFTIVSLCAVAWRARIADERLASLRVEAAEIVVLEDQLRTIAESMDATDAQIALQRGVGSPLEASRLVHAIAALVPEDAVLERLFLHGEYLSGEERVKRRRTDAISGRRYQCEVSGIAVDDATIARLVESLSAREPFEQVNLESSRNREFNGVQAREFRVSFSVNLDEPWTVRANAVHAAVESKETP